MTDFDLSIQVQHRKNYWWHNSTRSNKRTIFTTVKQILSKNYLCIGHLIEKLEVTLDKPLYVGQADLDLSKLKSLLVVQVLNP